MQVDVNVMNRGYLTRTEVMVDSSIQTLRGNVLYSFEPQYVEAVATDIAEPVSFPAKTKGMNLEAGTYKLEIFIDPDGNAGEDDAIRANNRVMVEFEVE